MKGANAIAGQDVFDFTCMHMHRRIHDVHFMYMLMKLDVRRSTRRSGAVQHRQMRSCICAYLTSGGPSRHIRNLNLILLKLVTRAQRLLHETSARRLLHDSIQTRQPIFALRLCVALLNASQRSACRGARCVHDLAQPAIVQNFLSNRTSV